jgi:anti-sigma regulatory factor (Ser/Thr protein kinase)
VDSSARGFPLRGIGAFPPLVEFASTLRASSGLTEKYELAGTKAVSGDNAARDDGDLRNPRKVERSVVLPYVPGSVTGARQGLCADLRALEICADRVDDAALILSELVSNALRHASPLPGHTVGVAWRAEVDPDDPTVNWLEIAVRDGGSSTMPRVALPSLSGLGGRGLSIVQSLAGRWGTEMDATTTTVWAVLELATEETVDEPRGTVTDLPVTSAADGRGGSGTADVVELDLRAREGERARGALL